MDDSEKTTAALHTAENILYPLIAGIGFIANAMVVVTVTTWERVQVHRTIANMFVVNLAIADMLFLAVLPLYMPALIDRGWNFGSFCCKFAEAIKYINFRASICFLTIMTTDRFFAIVYSLESLSYRLRKNGLTICVIVWLVSLFLSIPILVYADVYKQYSVTLKCEIHFPGYIPPLPNDQNIYDYTLSLFNNNDDTGNWDTEGSLFDANDYGLKNLHYNNTSVGENHNIDHANTTENYSNNIKNELNICFDKGHADSSAHIAWVAANFVIFFVVPIIVITYCYGRIIRETISRDVESTMANGVNVQLIRMVAILVSAFLVCWFPFQIFELLILPPGLKTAGVNECKILKSIFSMLAWMNSAINPLLYSFSSGRFRKKIKVAYEYLVYGRARVVAKQSSQRTALTKLHTAASSSKSTNVSSLATKMQPLSPTGKSGTNLQTKTQPYVVTKR